MSAPKFRLEILYNELTYGLTEMAGEDEHQHNYEIYKCKVKFIKDVEFIRDMCSEQIPDTFGYLPLTDFVIINIGHELRLMEPNRNIRILDENIISVKLITWKDINLS